MGHSGGGGKGNESASTGGAKGWGDVFKATFNPLADAMGSSDPIVDAAFKVAQKGTKEGSVGYDMLSTYDSRQKATEKAATKTAESAAAWQAKSNPAAAAPPAGTPWSRGPAGNVQGQGQQGSIGVPIRRAGVNTSLLTEEDE